MARILFCEDNPTIRRLLGVALRSSPHQIEMAPDGAAGLALAERWSPDLVVTDISMPDMDGFELVKALRRHPRLNAVPVLVMSATMERDKLESIVASGANGYLTKPFSPEALRQAIEAALN
ncbi:MAG TPA: response regulator [Candidatus Dormibacteraeota bacterium]